MVKAEFGGMVVGEGSFPEGMVTTPWAPGWQAGASPLGLGKLIFKMGAKLKLVAGLDTGRVHIYA